MRFIPWLIGAVVLVGLFFGIKYFTGNNDVAATFTPTPSAVGQKTPTPTPTSTEGFGEGK